MKKTPDKKLTDQEVRELLRNDDDNKASGETEVGRKERPIELYDFLQPSRFNKTEQEKMRRISANHAHSIAPGVSRLLGVGVRVQLLANEQMKWQHLVDAFSDEAMGYTFGMAPLPYRGVVILERVFAAACLEQMIGGPAEDETTFEFTDLEAKVFARLIWELLAPLPGLWSQLGCKTDFDIEIGEHVEEMRGAVIYSPAEDMFQMKFLISGEFSEGHVAICVPFDMIRGLSANMNNAQNAARKPDEETRSLLVENIRNTYVNLALEVGRAEIDAESLLHMRPGDVIILDTNIANSCRVRIDGNVKARAFPGVVNGKKAFKFIEEQ